jgi:hypothetical protein
MSLYIRDYSSNFNPAMPVIDINVRREADEDSVSVIAIVDSGADNTMIPVSYLDQLNIQKARTAWMVGVGGNRSAVTLYWVFIEFGTFPSLYTEVIGAINPDEIIIGRDIINQYAVLLNGPAHSIEIS